jgi:putative solute:sodium symporter small subunit
VTSPKFIAIRRKIRLLTGVLFTAWALTAFGWVWFARELNMKIGEWPVNFWMAAQGSLLVFVLLTALNAWCINRLESGLHGAQEQDLPPSH